MGEAQAPTWLSKPKQPDWLPATPTKSPASTPAAPPAPAGSATSEPSWLEVGGKAVRNLPSSAWENLKGAGRAIAHPGETMAGMSDLARGGLRATGFRIEHPGHDQADRRADAAFSGTVDRVKGDYGSRAGFKKKLAADPVGVGLDASALAGGVAGGLRGAGSAAEMAGVREMPWTKLTRPENADALSRRAAPILTKELSRTDLGKRQRLSLLDRHYKAFNGASEEDMRDVVRFIEGTAPGSILTPERLKAAQSLKRVLGSAGRELNAATGTPLREGYFPHNYDWPATGGENPSRVGSGTQMKQRTIETIDDALAQGLKERHVHPVEAVAHYLEDTYNRIAHERSLKALRAEGLAKWVPEQAIPQGWKKLAGPNTTRLAKPLTRETEGITEHTGMVPQRVLAAPESVARLHNNRLAGSIEGTDAGGLFKPVKKATDLARTGVLGAGSLAHTTLTSIKGIGSDVARGVSDLVQGNVKEGAKALAVSPTAPFRLVAEGSKAEKALLTKGPREEWASLYVDAGGRVSQQASYETSMRPNLYESTRRGTFVQDMKRTFAEVGKEPGGGAWVKALGKGAAETFGRTAETINHFTFKYQVPKLKLGVAKNEIEQYLRNNPGASRAEKLAMSRRIVQSVDNRFGEMVRDNNFWHTYYTELSRAALLSPSWVQGNLRLYGDAAKDLPDSIRQVAKGKGLNPETQAMFGVWASRTLVAGMMTKAITGKNPEGMDWVAPPTGGKNKDGSPERAQVLSSMKDIDQLVFGSAPTTEAFNKLNPAVQMAIELGENRDYFGHPIYRPEGVSERPGDNSRPEDMARFIGKGVTPIGLQHNDNPDSNIPAFARFAGIQAAGQKFANPDRYAANRETYGGRDWDAERRRRMREKAK